MAEKKTSVFINEVHYTNFGTDVNEGVEVAGPAGTNLTGWSLHFYNHHGKVYAANKITGIISNYQNGFGTVYYPKKGLIDDIGGIALVNSKNEIVQFLSYNSAITATEGPAVGKVSEVLPVSEGFFTSSGSSLQLVGRGSYYEDFKWISSSHSRGGINRGQEFVPVRATRAPNSAPSGDQPAQPAVPSNATVFVDVLSAKNRKDHRTDKYAGEGLIIRRSQEFSIEITGAALSAQTFGLLLTIHPEDQTVSIDVKDSAGDTAGYYAYASSKTDDSVKISVFIPATAPVGQYSLFVQADKANVTESPDPLIVLFNPWSKLDQVFLDNEELRQEYVLNEQGLIWRGSASNNRPVAWNFAQFQSKALNSALYLLSFIPLTDRGDVVKISRRFTVLENDKVLYGNWSGKYDGGKEPTSWTGSKEILNEFWETRQPVKWGQCWVFSGVLTSLMRTLGVPTRSVTNFESAHDTNGNRRVDKYFKLNGSADSDKTDDSVWNFHVWNDAWFSRPDLVDAKFNGWQAIDATPQEKSEDEYQCGPCPLYAIKNGVKVDYDWTFIYGEVNADVVQYVATRDGNYKPVSTKTDAVGFNISTKAVGKNEKEDITLQYKFPEGSKEERASFNALEAQKELQVSGRLVIEETLVGDPINVSIRLASQKPTEAGKSNAKIVVTGTIIYYNGKSGDQIFNSTQNVTLPEDGSETELTITVEEDKYIKYLKQNHEIDFRVFVYSDADADVDTLLYKRFTFQEEEPKIGIADQVSQKEQGGFKVSFTNPLSIPLTNVEFAVEGSGVISKQKSKPTTIPPKETVTVSFDLKGEKKVGNKIVKAQVSSNELETIYSFKEVKVV